MALGNGGHLFSRQTRSEDAGQFPLELGIESLNPLHPGSFDESVPHPLTDHEGLHEGIGEQVSTWPSCADPLEDAARFGLAKTRLGAENNSRCRRAFL